MLKHLADMRYTDRAVEAQTAPRGRGVERRWNFMGQDQATWTGDAVTPDSALGVPAVLACIIVLTEDIGSLPWYLYDRLAKGKGKAAMQAVNHPLFELLHDTPNPEMTSMNYREIVIGHLAGWGNSYSQKIYSKAGELVELWPLLPNRMRVFRDVPEGPRRYLYTAGYGDPIAFTQDEILHIPGFGFDGLTGYSRIEVARQAIAIMMATEKYSGSFFENDARPGVVLMYPNRLSDKALENIKASWNLDYKGGRKHSKVAVAEEGVKIETLGLPPEDSQFVQTKQWGLEEVCRIFRMQPHKIMHLIHATLNNMEQQSIEHVTDTLRPWAVRLEQNVNMQCLTEAERQRYYNEIMFDGLLRGDTAARYTSYVQGRQWGFLSANDIRELENLGPIDGGDTYMMPLNMQAVGQGAPMDPNTVNDQSGNHSKTPMIVESHLLDRFSTEERMKRAKSAVETRRRLMVAERPVIKDVAARCLRREIHDVKEAAGKYLKPGTGERKEKRDAGQMDTWLKLFYEGHQDFVKKQFAPVISSYGELVAGAAGEETSSDGWTPEIEQFVQAYLDSYAVRHCGISEAEVRKMVQRAIDEANASGADPLEVLNGDLADWEETRSDEIAGRESVREGNAVAKAVFVAAGFSEVVWVVTDANACNYCAGLDGQVVSVTKNFLNAGEDYQPAGTSSPLKPSGNVGHPPAHDGCECMLAAWN
jgi:HK97 family phage portal protein